MILDRDPANLIRRGKRQINGKFFGPVNKQLIAARFASTFSILLSSGMNILKAIEIGSKILGNKYMEEKLVQVNEDIKKGNPIGKSMEDINIFPIMLTQMITIGEETGQLEEIMKKTADFYDGEAQAAIDKMITLIEPMLIIGLAVIVFFIVLSIFLPMFSMYDAIGGF
ncbi:MAG: type II secretion system F family protein, partial [Clostridium sp.]